MKKWWVKLLLVIAAVVLLLVAWLAVSSIHATNAVERYKAQLRASGERLAFTDLIPPPLKPESNGVEFFNQAAPLLNSSAGMLDTNDVPYMKMVAPGKAMVGWQQVKIVSFYRGGATNTWQDLEVALQAQGNAFELLQKTVSRPVLDFGLDYRALPDSIAFQPMIKVKSAASILAPAVIDELHLGDTATAVTNLHTIIALVNAWQQPLMVAQLVRTAMASIADRAQWEVLQSTNLTDAQLALLQRDWEKMDFVQAFETAMVMERDFQYISIEHLRGSNSPSTSAAYTINWGGSSSSTGLGALLDEWGPKGVAIREKTVDALWRVSWSYEDELHMLQSDQTMIDAMRRVKREGFFQDALADLDRKLSAMGVGRTNGAWLRDNFDNDLKNSIQSSTRDIKDCINRALSTEVARRIVITAIALKRYQLRHGSLPLDLPALVPEFLSELPRDPVDGKPLRYHPNANGTFVLYSIGEDCKDGGGDVTPDGKFTSFYWLGGLDWVWPQPATPQEVQNYYDHPPK